MRVVPTDFTSLLGFCAFYSKLVTYLEMNKLTNVQRPQEHLHQDLMTLFKEK